MLKSEVIGPVGSGGPLETGHVICPGCAHNFTAIPENARERIAELEEIIRGITYSHDGKVHVSFYPGQDLLHEFPALAEIHSKGK